MAYAPEAALVILTVAVFVTLLFAYAVKLAHHRQAVLQELRHPVNLHFSTTISISFILLAIALLPMAMEIAPVL